MNTKNTTEIMPAEAGMPHGSNPPVRMVNAASQVRPLQLNDMSEMWRFAQAIVRADLLPKSYGGGDAEAKASKALIALQLGAEVGLMPMQSIQSIYVINGIPTLYGDSQLALVRQSGQLEYIRERVEGDVVNMATLKAIVEVKRKGDSEPVIREFSWADAMKAGSSNKETYKQHPKRMLTYRARAYALRDVFPDVLKGLTHTYEEMIDVTPQAPAATPAPTTQNMSDLLAAEAAGEAHKEAGEDLRNKSPATSNKTAAEFDVEGGDEEGEGTTLQAEDSPATT